MMIDLVFIVLLIIAIRKGYQKGLVVAVFSFLGVLVGLAAAVKLSAVLATHLHDAVSVSVKWVPILSFVLVFLAALLLVRWIAGLVQAALDLAMMGWLNRLGGIVLYVILFTAVYSVFLFYATVSHLLGPESIRASVTYPLIRPWGPVIIDGFGKIFPFFKDMFSDLEDFFSRIARHIG